MFRSVRPHLAAPTSAPAAVLPSDCSQLLLLLRPSSRPPSLTADTQPSEHRLPPFRPTDGPIVPWSHGARREPKDLNRTPSAIAYHLLPARKHHHRANWIRPVIPSCPPTPPPGDPAAPLSRTEQLPPSETSLPPWRHLYHWRSEAGARTTISDRTCLRPSRRARVG